MPRLKQSWKALSALLILGAATPLHAAIDSTLYTNYFLSGTTGVSYVVCGSTQQSSGCYGSGTLGPFGKIGAMLEGNPSTNLKTNTVSRTIYVLDVAYGPNGNEVALYVYKKSDTISPTFDTIAVTLTNTIVLPLTGGSTAQASMAANAGFLFIGTDQSPLAVRVQKSKFAQVQVGGFSPPINVTAITSNKAGYATVTYGTVASGQTGNLEFGPDGSSQGGGGGAWFMLQTSQATLPSALPQ